MGRGGREPPPLLLSAVWLQLSAVPPPHVRRPDLRAVDSWIRGRPQWVHLAGIPAVDGRSG